MSSNINLFDFLGPAVSNLNYWGAKDGIRSCQEKLNPFNCLFLALIKLRLNLNEEYLAFCFAFLHQLSVYILSHGSVLCTTTLKKLIGVQQVNK